LLNFSASYEKTTKEQFKKIAFDKFSLILSKIKNFLLFLKKTLWSNENHTY